ncbi:hypothetical protein BH23ACT2_BH23ACT2_21920 [soil metagenome]
MRTQRTRIAGIAAALLLVAACSDSVTDDGPTAGGASADPETRTTRGITDDTVTVGGVTYGLFFGDSATGVEARLKEVNDAGGVHGRTIEFVGTEDDENDATRSQEITQRLVEQEEVFAVLPAMSSGFGGTSDYIVDNDIPTFGWGVNPAFCDNDVAFGITGCVTNPSLEVGSNALGIGLEELFDGDTDQTIAFLGEDNDSARGGIALLEASVADRGFDVVMADPSLPAPPDPLGDPSPFVSRLISADDGEAPDIIYLLATLSGTQISSAIQATGYEGMIITPAYSPLLLGQPGYDGVWINTQIGMDPETPANAEMLDAIAEVDADQQLNLAVAAGYWTADLFIEALEATGEDLTVENLLATLNSGDFTYEVDGVVGLSEWPDSHSQSVPCSALTEVQGDEFVPTVPLACGENITVEG